MNKNILAKLHAVMQAVDRIEKDKKNTAQNYEYASEKIIKETLHTEFVDKKVIFKLETSNPQILTSDYKTASGNQLTTITFIDCKYTFYDVESGEEITGTFVGSGSARDDKGNYAAITGAIKYILTSTFLIPTGDDPEDNKNDTPQVKTPRKPSVEASEDVSDVSLCEIHDVPLIWGTSKKTGKRYQYHIDENNKYCFGRAE